MKGILRFSVDNQLVETPAQFLTGAQIKELAGVPAERELFLVVPEYEDEFISDETSVNLARPGVERFVTREKHNDLHLIVNGTRKVFNKTSISYEEVVKLAFPGADFGANAGFTITYMDGPKPTVEGILPKGSSVYTKDNMRFDVTATHKS